MKVFLSSTSKDLKTYRKRATEALERLGAQADRMEVWGAHPEEPLAECLNKVEQCDLFVGIYAYRYGYIPPGEEKSITELEYEHAKKLEKPCFCFLVDEKIKWPEEYKEGEPNQSKLKSFKAKVQKELMVAWFTTTLDLGMKVGKSLGFYLVEKGHASKGFSPPPIWTTEELFKEYKIQDRFIPLTWSLAGDMRSSPPQATLDKLPPVIKDTTDPQSWLKDWTHHWDRILTSEEDHEWLKERLHLLLNGFRSFYNTCLGDTLLTVPPLETSLAPLRQSLLKDRQSAIFAPPGTGKSRKLLYLAALWKQSHPRGEIFFCPNTREITSEQWGALRQLLAQETKPDTPLLLILDDLHHGAATIHQELKSLLDARFSTNTWWLGGYTLALEEPKETLETYQARWVKQDCLSQLLDYQKEWSQWQPYFKSWSRWIQKVVGTTPLTEQDWQTITTPWDVAVITGELDKRLRAHLGEETPEKAIYLLLAALFLLNNEETIPLSEVIHVLHQGTPDQQEDFKTYLQGSPKTWKDSLDALFQGWERPTGDLALLPVRPAKKFGKPITINFPHQKLAMKLWTPLSEMLQQLRELLERAYPDLQPGLTFFETQNRSLPQAFQQFSIGEKNIVRINLSFLMLSAVPPWVLEATKLQTLDLWWNQLKSLPESFGNLVNLKELRLWGNQLSTLPESFGQLTNLVELHLDTNKLSTLPESFGNLTNLQTLKLYGNQLQSLPETFGALRNLEKLELKKNQLSSLPGSFGNLVSLKELCLWDNQLSSLPESFGNLRSLQTLHLYNNKLKTLPESFSNLVSLKELHLWDNQLKSLPENFGDLKNLQTLDLRWNQLSSLPESFGNLRNLQHLELQYNQLSSLPESFGQLTNLVELHLDTNKLSSLPESFFRLTGLQTLSLESNLFKSLPETFGQLQNLETLWLQRNQLSSLPESFGHLRSLTYLDLGSNQLSSLPETFGNLRKLQTLWLQDNQLSSLPESFDQLTSLKTLHVDGPLKKLPTVQALKKRGCSIYSPISPNKLLGFSWVSNRTGS